MEPQLILPEIIKGPFENKFLEMSSEQYHADRTAVHSSSLIKMLKSPHSYKHHLMYPVAQTNAMKFGTIAHMAILEGSDFLKRYHIEPVHQGYTKKGELTTSMNADSVKQAKAEWHAALPPGAQVVTEIELDKIKRMIDSILDNEAAAKLLKNGIPEAKGTWVDPITQLRCIFSVDFLPQDVDVQVEFKTSADCRWVPFRRSVEALRYDVQFEHYRQGITAIRKAAPKYKVWIVTESDGSFETMVHEVNPIYEDTGAHDWKLAMRDIKQSIVTGKFPQAQTIIEAGEPTAWFRGEYELKGVI